MANDALTAGALVLGGGLAGYALGHWLDRGDREVPPPSPPAVAPQFDVPVSSPSQVEPRNARAARRWSREGRTLLRDGIATVQIVRVDLGDQRFAITPHETDVLADQIVRLLNRRNGRGGRAKTPPYRERWLVDDRCGYRAWLFWTGTPPESAVVGDAWAYLEKTSNGAITAKRRFRTSDEAYRYIKAALKRALERAGKDDCYGE